MCIIVEKKSASTTINRAWHDEFWASNPNGFGIVSFDSTKPFGQRVSVTKTMDKEVAWAIVSTLNDSHLDTIVHYRLATHGATGLDMCHPFIIDTAGGRIAVTHNGMLSDYPTPAEFDHKVHSDTYAFVRFFLEPALKDLDAEALRKVLRSESFNWQIETLLGGNNRLVITDQYGHVTYNDSIWHTKKGGSLDGVRLSNTYAWTDIDAPKVTNLSSYKPKGKSLYDDPDFDWDAYDREWDSKYNYTKPKSTGYTPAVTTTSNAVDYRTAIEEEAYDWIDEHQYSTLNEIEQQCLRDPELVANAVYLLLNTFIQE